jgi:hypothetical protein
MAYRLPLKEPWLCQPAMTATADATDSSTVEQLIATVEGLEETVKQQADRIDQLETELAEHKDHTGREFADVRGRITEVEENQQTEGTSDGETPGVEAPKEGSQSEQNDATPLEQIVRLPEGTAEAELTSNVRRARFIARDVTDYAEKCPAGYVMDSGAVRRVLSAGGETKGKAHTETVSRVMDKLDDFGRYSVDVKKRRGNRIVVFSEELVRRLSQCGDRSGGSTPIHNVIGTT